MWTDENLKDAKQLLLNSALIQRVKTDESAYIVADEVPYIDELYMSALDELVRSGELKSTAQSEDRESFMPKDATSPS
jgi:hypothetical protein